MQPPATRSLVVIEKRVRRVDDEIAALPDLEAQIDVVEHDAKGLVEAADLVEDAPRHHQTGPSHRAAVAREIRKPRAANGLARPRAEGIGSRAIHADHGTAVLNSP